MNPPPHILQSQCHAVNLCVCVRVCVCTCTDFRFFSVPAEFVAGCNRDRLVGSRDRGLGSCEEPRAPSPVPLLNLVLGRR